VRQLRLSKTGFNKLKSHHKDLKATDFEDSLKSVPPGEWCVFVSGPESWTGFVNPMIDDKYSCAQVVANKVVGPEAHIVEVLKIAFHKRLRFTGYEAGARIFYGANDGLGGLIIDRFTNASILQINTAGVDRYRELIRTTIAELTGVPAYFLDNAKYREKEFLPIFENPPLPDLQVQENGLSYRLRSEVIQKVGFYYDHRENRVQLQAILRRLKKTPVRGTDLFCYAGAWGLNALAGGAKHVDFVDQGDFENEVTTVLKENGFAGQGQFHRGDVFKFLDQAIGAQKLFDLVLCDPPAFAKSLNQKPQALEGYSKLHRKVFKSAGPGALLAFSSCTHYVTHEEFQKNILDAATKEGKKVQLIYSGLQGWDHPIASQDDRGNYIKSYYYIME
jgi:23S rRNA (cytosine1962-C5)-methyltransferase